MQQPVAPFSVRTTSQNGVARLALRGELDMSVTDLLVERLATFEGDGVSSIVLDLRDLSFVDASGLHVLLRARKRAEANGHQFRVVGASQAARRVFEITRTEFLFDDSEAVSPLDGSSDGNRSGRARVEISGDQHV